MTREIIENILHKEKTADELIEKAKLAARNITRQIDQKINDLQNSLKQEIKNLKEAAKQEIAEKIAKEKEKADKKLQLELTELEKIARKNFPKVKQKLLEEILNRK